MMIYAILLHLLRIYYKWIIAKNTAFVKRAAFSLKMRGFPDIFTDCFFGQKERNHPGFPRQFPLLYD